MPQNFKKRSVGASKNSSHFTKRPPPMLEALAAAFLSLVYNAELSADDSCNWMRFTISASVVAYKVFSTSRSMTSHTCCLRKARMGVPNVGLLKNGQIALQSLQDGLQRNLIRRACQGISTLRTSRPDDKPSALERGKNALQIIEGQVLPGGDPRKRHPPFIFMEGKIDHCAQAVTPPGRYFHRACPPLCSASHSFRSCSSVRLSATRAIASERSTHTWRLMQVPAPCWYMRRGTPRI